MVSRTPPSGIASLLYQLFSRFYHQAALAILDFPFYRTVFRQPARRTLLYLLFLSLHVAVLLTLIQAWQLAPSLERFSAWAQQHFPSFEIAGGRMRMATSGPRVEKYPGDVVVTFVFDTSGTYQDPAALEEPVLLFTRDRLLVRNWGQTQTYLWQSLPDITVTSETIRQLTSLFKKIYFPTFFLFWLLYKLVSHTVLSVLLSAVSLSAGFAQGVKVPLASCLTIGLYSLTPAVVIDLAVAATGLHISFLHFIFVITASLYTYLATRQCLVTE